MNANYLTSMLMLAGIAAVVSIAGAPVGAIFPGLLILVLGFDGVCEALKR